MMLKTKGYITLLYIIVSLSNFYACGFVLEGFLKIVSILILINIVCFYVSCIIYFSIIILYYCRSPYRLQNDF